MTRLHAALLLGSIGCRHAAAPVEPDLRACDSMDCSETCATPEEATPLEATPEDLDELEPAREGAVVVTSGGERWACTEDELAALDEEYRPRIAAALAAKTLACATVDGVTRCEVDPELTVDLVHDDVCHDGSGYIALRAVRILPRGMPAPAVSANGCP